MNDTNFDQIICSFAENRPETIFLHCARTKRHLNYRAFWHQIQELKIVLLEKGIRPSERVLLLMDNSMEFAVTFFALLSLQAVAVPVNIHLKWKEIEYILKDSQAVGIITDERYRSEIERFPEKDWEGIGIEVWLGILARDDGKCDSERMSEQQTAKELEPLNAQALKQQTAQRPECTPDQQTVRTPGQCIRQSEDQLLQQTAMILYTSGTTGHPKGVLLSYHNLLAETKHIIEAHELTERDCVLCVLPWFHINGLVITLLTPLVSGQRIIIGGKFSVRHFWDDIEQYQVTWFSGVPTMYSHMLARGIPENGTHSSLRFARSASSPLPVAVLEEFETTCHVPIIESYGITEGASQITSNPMVPFVRKPGSVGIPFGNAICIVDPAGNPVLSGEKGEVWIKGENITSGYFRKEEETQKAFTGEWFHSGDIGRLDEDGYLFLSGRIKELINRAGEKFSPVEVDEVLYQIPEVELAATVGVPDPVYGEKTAVFLKLRPETMLNEEQVINWCRERIASYKVPDLVYFVEDIPKGGNGKIQRLKLLETWKQE